MEAKNCPFCGSRYFLSARTENKIVFNVDEEGQIRLASEHDPAEAEAVIDPEKIFCGSCSWKGAVKELVMSDLCV